MSQFKQDIVKILLDKALLGLIAAAFGFYLSRLLEDYRTRNAYQLILSKERIDAFRKIIELITENHEGVTALLDTIDLAKTKYPLSDEETAKAFAHIERYKDFRQRISPHLAFMSQSLFELSLAYFAETAKVAEAIKQGNVQEVPQRESIDKAFFPLLEACAVAMNTPPPSMR
jgi:hypothetical protein